MGRFSEFVELILSWAQGFSSQESGQELGKYVCVAPVASCMESFWNEHFRQICLEADLLTPDGKPIVWALRKLGYKAQQQVAGPDLMLALCQGAAEHGIPIGLYGGSEESLKLLQQNLVQKNPTLQINYAFAAPFRDIGAPTPETELQAIRESGAKLLFVGIGCPKQELWMAQNKAALPLVMLGVGAAFLFHSGELRRAPHWLRALALEWLFRLLQEPKRLFWRYFKTNLAFLWYTRALSKRRLNKYLHH